MITEREYPKYANSFVRGLSWHRDHKKKPPEKSKMEPLPVCKLSECQMRELGAVTARVVEVPADSAFIKIRLDRPISRKTVFDAFDSSAMLQPDDEIVVSVRLVGGQSVVHILGIREV